MSSVDVLQFVNIVCAPKCSNAVPGLARVPLMGWAWSFPASISDEEAFCAFQDEPSSQKTRQKHTQLHDCAESTRRLLATMSTKPRA